MLTMYASATALEGEDEIAGMAEEGVQETARYDEPLSITLNTRMNLITDWGKNSFSDRHFFSNITTNIHEIIVKKCIN